MSHSISKRFAILISFGITFLFLLVPFITFAAEGKGIFKVLGVFVKIFGIAVVVLIALALVLFIWGVVKYIGAQGNEADRTTAREHMINGIIALFVIVSVWGLVTMLTNTFDIKEKTAPFLPEVPGRGSGAGTGGGPSFGDVGDVADDVCGLIGGCGGE